MQNQNILNLSKLVTKAIKELETIRKKGTDAETLAELAKKRKTTQKLARLLMIRALQYYKYPITKEIVDSTMRTDIGVPTIFGEKVNSKTLKFGKCLGLLIPVSFTDLYISKNDSKT